jgi:hypothetical protein
MEKYLQSVVSRKKKLAALAQTAVASDPSR